MAQSRYKRKLTAILSADVVGYSRLMGDDEEFTIQTLNSYRHLMTALIEQYSGSVVDAVGDNILAEFTSAADAVQCASAIQIKLKKQNENLSDSRRMHFRIGINIGDIVHEKNRIYGDGVNIAARIESLADPGGICISRNIYNHIKKQLDFEYDYMGEHSVKNISDPVRVYRVIVDPKETKNIKQESGLSAQKKQLKKKFSITASAILIMLALVAGLYWKYNSPPAPAVVEPASKTIPAAAPEDESVTAAVDPEKDIESNLPQGISIAVLPFVNMSKDQDLEHLCDGITENIIATLAKVNKLFVISRNSSFAYKDKSMNIQQIGQELNAAYIIEGSVQKTDEMIRIVVQLIETSSGLHIWSERYDRKDKDVFKLQDEITFEILKAGFLKLVSPYGDESITEGIVDLNHMMAIVKRGNYIDNPTKEGFVSALKNAREIIAFNPEYRHSYTFLTDAYITGLMLGYCESSEICLSKAIETVKKSLSVDENNNAAHAQMGWIFLIIREYDKATASLKKSIELNSKNAYAHLFMGWALNCVNKPLKALESIKTALRLNPVAPAWYLLMSGWSYLLLEEYEKAIELYNAYLKRKPNRWRTYVSLALAYEYSGQKENAKTAVKKLLNLSPNYSIEKFKKTALYEDLDMIERAAQALRNAGLPETSQ